MRYPMMLIVFALAAACTSSLETAVEPPIGDPVEAGGGVDCDAGPIPHPPVCPVHILGVMRCDEFDPLMKVWPTFGSSCLDPSWCPVGYRRIILNSLIDNPPTSCLFGGLWDTTGYVRCCSDDGLDAPPCSTAADCPVQPGECTAAGCFVAGHCGVATLNGDACSLGHCANGVCVEN